MSKKDSLNTSISEKLFQNMKKQSEKIDILTNEKEETVQLLKILSMQSFDQKYFIDKINEFTSNGKRFLYSEITEYIKAHNDEDDCTCSNILLNLEGLYQELDELADSYEVKKIIIKLWDHVNLANKQFFYIQDAQKKAVEIVDPFISKVTNAENDLQKIKKETKGLITQLISIVSIFVAISFVMFGGMSLLNNLFDYSNMTSIPLLEMICGGAFIGLIIVNSVYIFIIFILRITGRVRNESDLVYKSYIKGFSIFLIILIGITLFFWFKNIRNVDDVKYINSNCKTIEYNAETKEVTLVCPASDEDAK